MVVEFKINCRLILLTSIYISIGVAALLLAFPWVLVWIPKTSSDLASWVQAIFSIIAIIAVWIQTNKSFENQIKIIEHNKLLQLDEIYKEVSLNSRWLNLKIKDWEFFLGALATGSTFGIEADNSKEILLMELNEFERRFLKYSSHQTFDSTINHQVEIIINNLKKLILKLNLGMTAKEVIGEMLVLQKNAEAIASICTEQSRKIHEKTHEKLYRYK